MNTDFIPSGMTNQEILRYHGHTLPATVAERLQEAIAAEDQHETDLTEKQDELDKANAAADAADDKLRELVIALQDTLGPSDDWPNYKKAGLLELLKGVQEILGDYS